MGPKPLLVLALSAVMLPVLGQQPEQKTQAQQRPTFRAGTHFVRVDAYPLQDGRIVEGLEPGDFEVFEDGKPQTVESRDFVRFDTFSPLDERLDPHTWRESFELAADPRNRVFVVFSWTSLPAAGWRRRQAGLQTAAGSR